METNKKLPPDPGWSDCPNIFFQQKIWTLPNGIRLKITQEKKWGSGRHPMLDYILIDTNNKDRQESIMEWVFMAFLRLAGKTIEQFDPPTE